MRVQFAAALDLGRYQIGAQDSALEASVTSRAVVGKVIGQQRGKPQLMSRSLPTTTKGSWMAIAFRLSMLSLLPISGSSASSCAGGIWDRTLCFGPGPATLTEECGEAHWPWGLHDWWYEPIFYKGPGKSCLPQDVHTCFISQDPLFPPPPPRQTIELLRPQEGIVVWSPVSSASFAPCLRCPGGFMCPPFPAHCGQLQKELFSGDVSRSWLKQMER